MGEGTPGRPSGSFTLDIWTQDPGAAAYVFDDQGNQWKDIYDEPSCDCKCAVGDPDHYKQAWPITLKEFHVSLSIVVSQWICR